MPGQQVPQGASIDLVVSQGKGITRVANPSLEGYTLEDALPQLLDLGLELGEVKYSPSILPGDEGIIYRQEPSPLFNDSVKVGTRIHLHIYGNPPN